MNGPARRIAVVTGSRAEFGLLRPVMRAILDRPELKLDVLVTGAHLIPPAPTAAEVSREFDVAAVIPMQQEHRTGRWADAEAVGRGVTGFARWFADHPVDIVVVLGDRIEAFAAATAAALGGIRVAHLHGGDRAAGITDDAMRHAVTKLAHIHLPATPTSGQRIAALGEDPARIHVVGSPAIDDLDEMPPLPETEFEALGRPEIVFLMHPTGLPLDRERARACTLLAACARAGRVLALHPNHDPGREGIVEAIRDAGVNACPHLARRAFVGLLRRVAVLAGNSSAGLIECAALGVPCVNVGSRQAGRERPGRVIDVPDPAPGDVHRFSADFGEPIRAALDAARAGVPGPLDHSYGTGAGRAAARLLATLDPAEHPLEKLNSY